MSISIHTCSTAINLMVCTSIGDIRSVMCMDAELQMLQIYIIRGWLQNKDKMEPPLSRYWKIRHDPQ